MHKHELKVWREFFPALLDGSKTFEVRYDDRSYAVGDVLVLKEWNPAAFPYTHSGDFTGRSIEKLVTYKMPGGRFGLGEHYCVLGLGDVR